MDFGDLPRPTPQEQGMPIQELTVSKPTVLALMNVTRGHGLRMVLGRNPGSSPGEEDVQVHLEGVAHYCLSTSGRSIFPPWGRCVDH